MGTLEEKEEVEVITLLLVEEAELEELEVEGEPVDLRPGMEHLGSSESRVMSHVPRVILVIICVALQPSP